MKTRMSKEEMFEMGDDVLCIKSYGNCIEGRIYHITGSGDLRWNMATDKKGYGFGVCPQGILDKKMEYFTYNEMFDYFTNPRITELRDDKINKLLDIDKYN
jgi:hypothetical protein